MAPPISAFRAANLALFFANAVFCVLFKAVGVDALRRFGTFRDCDEIAHPSCAGNQMVFRASFSIALFFLVRTLLSRFVQGKRGYRTFMVFAVVEVPIYVGMLVGSFFIPPSFFDGYMQFARVGSGFFILFQIISIVDFAYSLRDTLLDQIERSIQSHESAPTCASAAWAFACKTFFLATCIVAIAAAGVGIALVYKHYGGCGVGMAFTTVTVVGIAMFLVLGVSTWLDVGLLPPSIVAAYLVLMCWQALTSNPSKSCSLSHQDSIVTSTKTQADDEETPHAIVLYALIGAFSVTWTSWRTSDAASTMLAKDLASRTSSRKSSRTSRAKVEANAAASQFTDLAASSTRAMPPPATASASAATSEHWSFYLLMLIASIYMAMALTDWNSAQRVSNGVALWVKIVAQWLTMLLFLWTLLAPKLFPDRDFTVGSNA